MTRDIPLPPLDPDLVKALDQRFPERCPDPKQSDREIWVMVGERRVVRFLIQQLAIQRERILES